MNRRSMKPDWFKLTDSDKPDPIDSDYRPISVLAFILVIVLTGVVFLYPAENPDPCINPTVVVDPIQTPIAPIQMPSEDEKDDD
jgi:hypothetical protein